MWEIYLCRGELAFRRLNVMVFHLQLAASLDAVPLTRDYMYKPDYAEISLPRRA